MATTAAELNVRFTSSGAGQVKGELRGLDDALKSAGSGFEQMYQQVSSFADRALSGITSLADGIGKIGVAGLTTLFVKGATAAWNQVDAVEQATIALRAYETDARKVDQVLEDLLEYARSDAGKLFLREELFHAAQAMRVAGAETESLTRYVEIMSRSVSSGMGTWIELERVLGRVVSTGRLTTIEFELLQQMGFQLDESLRNTTVTADELFDALDRGSVTIEGQTETIRGRIMSLNTAIRSIGTAFLAVDADTSQFIQGGLGDRLVGGIDASIAALGRLRPAAESAGSAIVLLIDAAAGIAGAFQMLPGPLQNITLGIIGAIAAWGMFRQAIAATTAAMRLMGLASFTALFTPLGAAIAGVVAVGGLLVNSFLEQKEAAETYKQSVVDLETALEMLRRKGDTALADLGDGLKNTVNQLDTQMAGLIEAMRPDMEAFDLRRFREEFGREFDPLVDDMSRARQIWAAEWQQMVADFDAATDDLAISTQDMTDINLKLLDALQDPDINVEAWITWADGLLTGAENAEELRAAVDEIIDTPLSEWSRHAADGVTDFGGAIASQMGVVSAAKDELAEYIVANEEYFAALEEGTAAFHDNVAAWIGDGDNIIQFLNTLLPQLQQGEEWMTQFFEREWALNLDLSGAASELDQVLRTFEQIDALGQRASASGAIMDALFGPNGDPNDGIGPLRDLYDVGRIGQTQFNQTIEDGIAIQYRAAEAEALLNELRVDQVPLLRAQQDAYVDQLDALTRLEPAEQRRVLMLQDAAVRTQIADLYAQAYAASVGQIPEQVATDMIINAAKADADLASLLEAFGLIEETVGPNGELSYEVNLPGADESIQAMDRLTVAMFEVAAAGQELEGLTGFDIAVNVLGEEEAKELYGLLEDNDGRTSEAAVNVDTLGGDLLAALLGDLDMVDGRAAEAAVNTTTTGAEDVQQVSDDVTELDGTQANATVVGTVVNAEQIGDVFELLRSIEETGAATLSVTVDVDMSALNPFGLGFSDGGGAAGFTPMTAYIDVAIGENELDGYTPPTFDPVMIDVATDGALLAIENLNGVANAAREATALGVSITVNAPGSDIVKGALDDVTAAANAIPEAESVTVSTPGALVSALSLGAVRAAAEAIPDAEQVAVSVVGAETAVNSLNAVANAAASIPASVSTTITTNRVTTFSTIGSPISAFADGGYVRSPLALVGEEGPELVQLPYGSFVHTAEETARLLANRSEGIAPARTTAGGTATTGGGITLNIDVHGNVYGVDDLTAEIAGPLVAAMAEENRRHRAAQGVMA